MIVQIYEVNSATEAIELTAIGVDHIGVLVGESVFPREISSTNARIIFDAVPAEATKVALSLSSEPKEIARVIRETRPDIIHIGSSLERFTVTQTRELRYQFPAVRIMRSIPMIGEDSIAYSKEYVSVADLLLLDSHKPGDQQIGALRITHDWNISKRIVSAVGPRAILAGGLGPDNVLSAIETVGAIGVDSKTKTDRSDGSGKDIEKVRRFVLAAKQFKESG